MDVVNGLENAIDRVYSAVVDDFIPSTDVKLEKNLPLEVRGKKTLCGYIASFQLQSHFPFIIMHSTSCITMLTDSASTMYLSLIYFSSSLGMLVTLLDTRPSNASLQNAYH
jgi:hypothetical protein